MSLSLPVSAGADGKFHYNPTEVEGRNFVLTMQSS
jgi:hypothetical protein